MRHDADVAGRGEVGGEGPFGEGQKGIARQLLESDGGLEFSRLDLDFADGLEIDKGVGNGGLVGRGGGGGGSGALSGNLRPGGLCGDACFGSETEF